MSEPLAKPSKQPFHKLMPILADFFPSDLCPLIVDYYEIPVIRDTRRTIVNKDPPWFLENNNPPAWFQEMAVSRLNQEEAFVPYKEAAPMDHIKKDQPEFKRQPHHVFIPCDRVEGHKEFGLVFGDSTCSVYKLRNHLTNEGSIVSESKWTGPDEIVRAACSWEEARGIFHIVVMTLQGLHYGCSTSELSWSHKTWKEWNLLPMTRIRNSSWTGLIALCGVNQCIFLGEYISISRDEHDARFMEIPFVVFECDEVRVEKFK